MFWNSLATLYWDWNKQGLDLFLQFLYSFFFTFSKLKKGYYVRVIMPWVSIKISSWKCFKFSFKGSEALDALWASYSMKSKLLVYQFKPIYQRKLFKMYNIQYLWGVSHCGTISLTTKLRNTYRGVLLLLLKFASTLLKETFLRRLFWRLVMTVMIPNCKTSIIISSTKFILEFVFLIYLNFNLLALSMFSASLVCLYQTSGFSIRWGKHIKNITTSSNDFH